MSISVFSMTFIWAGFIWAGWQAEAGGGKEIVTQFRSSLVCKLALQLCTHTSTTGFSLGKL